MSILYVFVTTPGTMTHVMSFYDLDNFVNIVDSAVMDFIVDFEVDISGTLWTGHAGKLMKVHRYDDSGIFVVTAVHADVGNVHLALIHVYSC